LVRLAKARINGANITLTNLLLFLLAIFIISWSQNLAKFSPKNSNIS
jgi:hypothetical protein